SSHLLRTSIRSRSAGEHLLSFQVAAGIVVCRLTSVLQTLRRGAVVTLFSGWAVHVPISSQPRTPSVFCANRRVYLHVQRSLGGPNPASHHHSGDGVGTIAFHVCPPGDRECFRSQRSEGGPDPWPAVPGGTSTNLGLYGCGDWVLLR